MSFSVPISTKNSFRSQSRRKSNDLSPHQPSLFLELENGSESCLVSKNSGPKLRSAVRRRLEARSPPWLGSFGRRFSTGLIGIRNFAGTIWVCAGRQNLSMYCYQMSRSFFLLDKLILLISKGKFGVEIPRNQVSGSKISVELCLCGGIGRCVASCAGSPVTDWWNCDFLATVDMVFTPELQSSTRNQCKVSD